MSALANAINVLLAEMDACAKDLDPRVEYRTVTVRAVGQQACFASR